MHIYIYEINCSNPKAHLFDEPYNSVEGPIKIHINEFKRPTSYHISSDKLSQTEY